MPVVPIVIRNAGELMWRDSLTIKPGTVQVAVLPPIDVSAWPADQVRNKTREVQAMFADTLAHWPGDPRPAPKDPAPPRRPLEGRPRKAAQEGRSEEDGRQEDGDQEVRLDPAPYDRADGRHTRSTGGCTRQRPVSGLPDRYSGTEVRISVGYSQPQTARAVRRGRRTRGCGGRGR